MRASPPRPSRLTRALLAVALAGLACRDPAAPATRCDRAAQRCILFVGNSLTYVNDLPGIVAALGDSAGIGPVVAAEVAYPDFGLPEHWEQGDARREIETRRWALVVLQQGPSALPESRIILRDYAARFAAVIRAAGGTPALCMTWPAIENFDNFAASSESYRLAAADVDGVLFAVGDAWRAAWRRDPSLALYGEDGFHPSTNGSYLAALVIVGRIGGRATLGLPSHLRTPSGAAVDVDAATAATLQAAADEVNAAARR